MQTVVGNGQARWKREEEGPRTVRGQDPAVGSMPLGCARCHHVTEGEAERHVGDVRILDKEPQPLRLHLLLSQVWEARWGQLQSTRTLHQNSAPVS